MRNSACVLAVCAAISAAISGLAPVRASADALDRSPVDLVLSSDEAWILTANQGAGTVSLVSVQQSVVVDELEVGRRPMSITLVPDRAQALVACGDSGELLAIEFNGGKLRLAAKVVVGGGPNGVAVDRAGGTAFVAQELNDAVAVVDLKRGRVVGQIPVGRWPRSLALSHDGKRLAVANNGSQSITIVDVQSREPLRNEPVEGLNFGHLAPSRDGVNVYFPWMIYRHNPINPKNIRAGWVLGSRIARVRFDESARRQAMTLDPQGEAVADPYGIGLTSDESTLVASASGTHELLVYRMKDLVFQDFGGPGDHIDPQLAFDRNKFYRVPLGGRPMGLRIAGDDRRVFVANYLDNSVQEVDLEARAVVRRIDLGGAAEPSLARLGEAIFYDGRRSLDQWYSCHTCHYEGGGNAVPMDTNNDHTARTFKTVLPLANVSHTAPWTWHGWQTDLADAMRTSMLETMQGPEPSDADVTALVAYLDTLEPRRDQSPLTKESAQSHAAARGKQLFEGDRAACATCHSGPYLTDGLTHDVGLAGHHDAYKEFNTPSLVGVASRVRWLHDGRAKSLESVLTGDHNPEKVSGQPPLDADELADLIEYLKTL